MSDQARPIGGPIFTPGFKVLVGIAVVGAALVVWRLFTGVGSITSLSDGYAWGIWKPLNVVTFTGIGAGAYALGILCYVLNRGQYHPLVRPAILTGALGYLLAGLSVMIDLGRWWESWKLPFVWIWNVNSALLEVAICVISYVLVLWVEVTPAVLESWKSSDASWLKRFAAATHPKLLKALPWIIALAIVLPTMHQSSLGSLYMIAGSKLHALWHTPWLPLLFLVSCLVMGYGSVVLLVTLLHLRYQHPLDMRLMRSLGKVTGWLMLVYLAVRLGDIAYAGRLPLVAKVEPITAFFWLEVALFLVPAVFLIAPRRRYNLGVDFGLAMCAVIGGALYRFDTYLTAFDPGPGWSYFPSVGEVLVSLGLASMGMSIFIAMARRFPILSGAPNVDPPFAGEPPAVH